MPNPVADRTTPAAPHAPAVSISIPADGPVVTDQDRHVTAAVASNLLRAVLRIASETDLFREEKER